jgi:HlyD family secretion protein
VENYTKSKKEVFRMDAEIVSPAGSLSPEPAKKKAIRNAIIIFMICLVLLTLFSNTLLNYSLPRVTLTKPDAGSLVQSIIGTGTVEAAETTDFYLDVNWPAANVPVKVGDRVTAGQVLVSMDTTDARATLQDEQARAEQQIISLRKLENSYVDANIAGDDKQLRAVELDLKNTRLDIQMQDRKVQQLQRQLEKNVEIKSPYSGIITELNAVKGKPVPNGSAAIKVANTSKGQLVKANIEPAKAIYVKAGDTVDLLFASLNNAQIKATLTQINEVTIDQVEKKELVFELKEDRLKGGETASFTFFVRLPPSRSVLPNNAVRSDDKSTYVIVVKEKKGVLGNEFYVQRANVQVGDSDDTHTEIINGFGPLDKVVLSSNKPIADGDRVMIGSGS